MSESNTYQGVPEWYNARLFHFTASELHKLLAKPRAGEVSKTAEAYIFDKLAEELTDGTCLDYIALNTREVRWGHEHEADARAAYEARTGSEVEFCGFVEYSPAFGASPDGLVGAEGGIEIKCPYNTSNHARNLLLSTPEELLALHPDYYAQMQGNMLATSRQWWDFVSYDPRCQSPAFELKILRVPRDEAFIARIVEAVDAAYKYKESLIERIAANA